MRRFHAFFHNGINFKEYYNEINFHNYLESLVNPTKESESSEEETDSNEFEVKIRINELLVSFVLFSVGLFFSIIVFVLEIFYKTIN